MTTQKRKTTTKNDLKAALTRLLREKDFEAISVSDITKEAGVNRGTFYLHYVDKFDMMDKLIDEILQNILTLLKEGQPKNKQEAFPGIVKIFEYLKEDFDFIHAMTLNRFNYTAKLVHDFLLELTRQIGPIKKNIEMVYPLPDDYAQEVFIYSNSAIFFHWIQKGGVETPEEIAKIFLRMSVYRRKLMQKNIMKDPLFLSQKSTAANPKADAQVVRDLQDTLRANRERCVGMAANMIGVKKNIIIVAIGPMDLVILNPRITKKQGPYETEEGCLSHTGTKKTTRYQTIEVAYTDPSGKKHTGTFTDFTAQIIQHEIDHLDGVLI